MWYGLPEKCLWWNEPWHDKTNKMACAPSKDSDQPGHPPSLIRVFAVRMKRAWVLSYPLSMQRRLWSDRADAQVDKSLHWVHSHVDRFVMRWLISWNIWNTADTKHDVQWRSTKHMCHEKTCLCHMRPTKVQISLRIRAVWSAPLLFTA